MKTTKIIMTMVLSLVLMIAVCATAFAADEVPATEAPDGNYDTMLISAASDEDVEEATETIVFADVAEDAWYYEAAQFVAASGYAEFFEDGNFKPNAVFTVGDVVKAMEILKASGFDVVNVTEIATNAGFSLDMLVDLDAEITREQVVVMLWHFAQTNGADVSVGEDTNILSYTDALEIGENSFPAVQWACGAGIINGYPDGTLRLSNAVTRAELAKIAMTYFAE